MKPIHLFFGALFSMTAVIFGAFGAHVLKDLLTPEQLTSYHTGVEYQMYHGLALTAIALKGHSFHLRFERWIVSAFGLGIVLFSFSIYLLSLQDVLQQDWGWLGPVTPIGGLLLITGWMLMFIDAIQLISIKKQ